MGPRTVSVLRREAGNFFCLLSKRFGGKSSHRTVSKRGKIREEAKSRTKLCLSQFSCLNVRHLNVIYRFVKLMLFSEFSVSFVATQ